MALPDGFVQSLVDYAEQIDDVSPLEEWRDSLWTKMLAGDGKTMVSSAPGGRSFTFQVTITVEELFHAVVKAIKLFNDEAGDSPITFIDFSGVR
jgi:hypothetical protein